MDFGRGKRQSGVKDDATVFAMSNGKDALAID